MKKAKHTSLGTNSHLPWSGIAQAGAAASMAASATRTRISDGRTVLEAFGGVLARRAGSTSWFRTVTWHWERHDLRQWSMMETDDWWQHWQLTLVESCYVFANRWQWHLLTLARRSSKKCQTPLHSKQQQNMQTVLIRDKFFNFLKHSKQNMISLLIHKITCAVVPLLVPESAQVKKPTVSTGLNSEPNFSLHKTRLLRMHYVYTTYDCNIDTM